MPLICTKRWTVLTLLASAIAASAARGSGETPTAAHSSPAASAVARLLTADTTPGKARPELIRPLYDQAVAVAPSDPRLEYAYSLVLLKVFQPAEAREHLERALQLDPHFAPAHQAVIREQLKARQYNDAAERIATLADTLDSSRPDAPDVAEWLGRIVASVVIAIGTPDAQSQFNYQDRMLRTSLTTNLRSRYAAGYAGVEREFEELTGSIEEARSTAQTKQEAVKAKLDAELVKDQEEIKIKQQDAQKSRQKWDEWITDQTSKADDLLKEQEKRFRDLETTVNAQIQSVTALRTALMRIDDGTVAQVQQVQQQQQQQQQRRGNSLPIIFPRVGVMPNRNSLELQLVNEERRLAALYDQQAAVANAANRTLAARRQAVAQYQQATGVVMKESANLDRWEKRNKSIADNQKKAAEKKPVQVATLEAKIKSLNTWDPTDFESEKRRLLADLGINTNAK